MYYMDVGIRLTTLLAHVWLYAWRERALGKGRLSGDTVKQSLMLALLQVGWLFCAAAQAADDVLCAVVVIEIEQEAVFERQGFVAKMAIANALDRFSLEDLQVDVLFQDTNGHSVEATTDTSSDTALFFITLTDSSGISGDTDGNGTILSNSTARLEWLIVPAPGAANTSGGDLYYVGARVSYRYGNEKQVVDVAPDTILVRPMPEIALDYFLTEEVIADDPFTPEIEPPVPYTLGLRASNNGAGPARMFEVASSQPRIVDNQLGLAISFDIIGSYVGNAPARPVLDILLGDIQAGESKIARWIMQSTLSGRFTDFSATYTHAERMGGNLTSLISSVNTHVLVKDVIADLPGRDQVHDFLVVKGSDYLLFESDKTGVDLPVCQNCQSIPAQGAEYTVRSRPGGTVIEVVPQGEVEGAAYIKLPVPDIAGQQVTSAFASRGSQKGMMPLSNVWISQERDEDKINFNYFLNIFTLQSGSAYEITVGSGEQGGYPPVFQPVTARQVAAGATLGFVVRADGPAGSSVGIEVTSAPAGANFTRTGDNTHTLIWNVPLSASGSYTMTFIARNSYGESRLVVPVKVIPHPEELPPEPAEDLPDWLKDKLGGDPYDPVVGGTDLDGDGFSLLEEYLAGSDPHDPTSTPLSVAQLYLDDESERPEEPLWQDMIFLPGGEHGLVLDIDGGLILFSRDASSGALAPLARTPQSVHAGVLTALSEDQFLLSGYSENGYGVALYRLHAEMPSVELLSALIVSENSVANIVARPTLDTDRGRVYLSDYRDDAIHLIEISDQDLLLQQTLGFQTSGLTLLQGLRAVALHPWLDLLLIASEQGLGALPLFPGSGLMSDYATLKQGNEHSLTQLAFHPQGDYLLATSGSESRLVVLDTEALAFQVLTEHVVHANCGQNGIALGYEQRLFYGGCGASGVSVYGYDLGRGITNFIHGMANGKSDPDGNAPASMAEVQLIAPSMDGRHLYVYAVNSEQKPALVRFRHERDWYQEPEDEEPQPEEPDESEDPEDPEDEQDEQDEPGLIDQIIDIINDIIKTIRDLFRRWF